MVIYFLPPSFSSWTLIDRSRAIFTIVLIIIKRRRTIGVRSWRFCSYDSDVDSGRSLSRWHGSRSAEEIRRKRERKSYCVVLMDDTHGVAQRSINVTTVCSWKIVTERWIMKDQHDRQFQLKLHCRDLIYQCTL